MLRSAYSFSILVLSIDREEELVNLSLLPVDTGKPDVLPESLHLPLRLTGEEKKKYDSERMKKKRKVSESEQVIDGLSSLSLPCLLSLRPQYHSPTLTPGPQAQPYCSVLGPGPHPAANVLHLPSGHFVGPLYIQF